MITDGLSAFTPAQQELHHITRPHIERTMIETLKEWVGLLNSSSKHHRLEAARHLADLGDPSTCDAIAQALSTEKNSLVKVELGVALGLMNDRRALPGLMTAITKERPTDLTAIALLAQFGDNTCLDALRGARKKLFLHPLVKVRLTATMAALDKSATTRVELVGFSRSPKAEIRNYALELIGETTTAWSEYLTRLEEAASGLDDHGDGGGDGGSRLFALKALKACARQLPQAGTILDRVLSKSPLDPEESESLTAMETDGENQDKFEAELELE